MATRLLFQLFFFLLPFLAFGVYRVAVAEAELEGRKPWPIRWLFGIGAVLAVGSWVAFIMLDRGDGNYCYTPSRMVDGELVAGERYPCDRDLSNIGVPRSEDPGGSAEGVGTYDPLGGDGGQTEPE